MPAKKKIGLVDFMFPLFTFTTNDMLGITGWATEVVGDAMPLLIVIIGIAIGVWVIRAIFHQQ